MLEPDPEIGSKRVLLESYLATVVPPHSTYLLIAEVHGRCLLLGSFSRFRSGIFILSLKRLIERRAIHSNFLDLDIILDSTSHNPVDARSPLP